MQGQIDRFGNLHIMRNGVLRPQECPYRQNSNGVCCGEWCPLFSEPQEETIAIRYDGNSTPSERVKTGKTILEICGNKVLYFDKFHDCHK